VLDACVNVLSIIVFLILILVSLIYFYLKKIFVAYGCVMWRYAIPNKIFNTKMKIYKPLHSYPTLAY